MDKDLRIGRSYSKDYIKDFFNIGDAGGIRYSLKNNLLVLTQSLYDNSYQDSIDWDNNTIDYVGTGNDGDQSINYRENQRLFNSNDANSTIHLFFRDAPNHNIYFGTVKLIDTITTEYGLDKNNRKRKLIVFRLKINSLDDTNDRFELNNIYNSIMESQQKVDAVNALKFTTEKLVQKVIEHEINDVNNDKGVVKRFVNTTKYDRNQYLVALAIKFSNGICQLCGNKAPFYKSDGTPFLEVHHIDWLSNGGKDSIYNVIAICPNCHRKMHILNIKKDVSLLKDKAKRFADSELMNYR